jgi:ssDNA-binding replication factor A large subunit
MKTEAYINKIIEDTGLSKKEIQDLMEEKKEELKGLISDEGALFVIAKELGVEVSGENQELLNEIELNISDITLNMKNIVIVGRIKDIFSLNSFKKSNGEVGYVGSFQLHDNTGDIRIVLWDDHVNVLKDERFEKNEIVKVLNGNAKQGRYGGIEIHIGRFSKILLAPEDVDYKKYPKIKDEFKLINEIDEKLGSLSIEGKVMNQFPVRDFIRKDGKNGKVSSLLVRDSSGRIRISFWNEDIDKIENIDIGDFISLSNLNPRKSNFTEGQIDLHASSWTQITKKDKEVKFDLQLIDNIGTLQNKKGYISFQGIISAIDDLRRITTKSGEEMSLLGFTVSDTTDAIRVIAWREKADELSKSLKNGDGVLLKDVELRYSNYSQKNEVSISSDSSIEKIDLKIENIKISEPSSNFKQSNFSGSFTEINTIQSSGFFEIKGVITNELKNIRFYEACSECRRKIENCKCDKTGDKKLTMITSHLLEDESGKIRATFIGEAAEKLVGEKAELIVKVKDTPDYEKLLKKLSSNITGRDIMIKGRVKFNDYSDSYEIVASNFQDINVDDDLENQIKEFMT